METKNVDPRTKADGNNTNAFSDAPGSPIKSESEADRHRRARNYKEGEDDIEGPNLNEDSEGADGDTTANAGIFK